MWTVTVPPPPHHQGRAWSRRSRPKGPSGLLDLSQAMTLGLQALQGRGGAVQERTWAFGALGAVGACQARRGLEPRGGGRPSCHLAEGGLFHFTRGLCKESRRLFLIGFIFHLLGKWNISWEVTSRDQRQVSRQRESWQASEVKVT